MALGARRRSPKIQVYVSKGANTRSNQCFVVVRENAVLQGNVGFFWIPELPLKPPSNLCVNQLDMVVWLS